MTQQRLEQLRGNLSNLRDSTDDYRAAVLARWVGEICDGCAAALESGEVVVGHDDALELLDDLADALGIAPIDRPERTIPTRLVITGFREGQPEALPLDEIGIAPDGEELE